MNMDSVKILVHLFLNYKIMIITLMKKKKLILLISILFSVFLIFGVLFVRKAPAGPGLPFGGLRVLTVLCTCIGSIPGSAAITITDYSNSTPKPLTLLYTPGFTDTRPYYNVYSGTYLLGNYSPGAVCLIQAGKICVPAVPPPIGTMLLVGTSH